MFKNVGVSFKGPNLDQLQKKDFTFKKVSFMQPSTSSLSCHYCGKK